MSDQVYMAGRGRAFAVLGFVKIAGPIPKFKMPGLKSDVLPVMSEVAHAAVPGLGVGALTYYDMKNDGASDGWATAGGVANGLLTGGLIGGAKRLNNNARRDAREHYRQYTTPADTSHLDPRVMELIQKAKSQSPNQRKMHAYMHPDNASRIGVDPEIAQEAFRYATDPRNAAMFDDMPGVKAHASAGRQQSSEFAQAQREIENLERDMRGFM